MAPAPHSHQRWDHTIMLLGAVCFFVTMLLSFIVGNVVAFSSGSLFPLGPVLAATLLSWVPLWVLTVAIYDHARVPQ